MAAFPQSPTALAGDATAVLVLPVARPQVMVFDDSFEHTVWNYGAEYRYVLYCSIWHPGLWRQLGRGDTTAPTTAGE